VNRWRALIPGGIQVVAANALIPAWWFTQGRRRRLTQLSDLQQLALSFDFCHTPQRDRSVRLNHLLCLVSFRADDTKVSASADPDKRTCVQVSK
jgi:hypothetical protein